MIQLHVLAATDVGSGVEGNKMHFPVFPISQSECGGNDRSGEPGRPCLPPLNWILLDQTSHLTWALQTVTSYIGANPDEDATCDRSGVQARLLGDQESLVQPSGAISRVHVADRTNSGYAATLRVPQSAVLPQTGCTNIWIAGLQALYRMRKLWPH